MEGVTVRLIRRSDFNEVLGWMVAEGWVVNANMYEATHQWDPHGWLVAEDAGGQLLGSIASCALTEELAAGGFFIVRPSHRFKGVGKKLWDARLHYLGGRNLGIDAVQGRIEANKAKGFVHQTFEMATYIGQLQQEKITSDVCKGVELVIYSEDMLDELAIYDATIHQVERKVFLKQFLKPDIATTLVAKRNGSIIGYGSIQPVEGSMQHVGPVFAEEVEVGRALFNSLFKVVPGGQKLTMDLALRNALAQEMITTHSLNEDLRLTRMYNRAPVDLPINKVFAITTLGVSVV